MSRGGNNNFAPPPAWRSGQVYGGYLPNSDNWNYTTPPQPFLPRFVGATPFQNSIGTQDDWWPIQERLVTGSSGLARIPPPTHPTMQIIVLNNGLNQQPRPSSIIPQSNIPQTQDQSLSTQNDQKNALNMLKREIYNPTPKKIIQRMNLYYRDTNIGNRSSDRQKEIDDDDGKRCAICLDDFEPRQAVTLTPCNHMFHDECIVPWVKSHGQCPVCRFVISERVRQSAVTSNNNGVNNGGVPSASELVSVIRAMEEAMQWRRRGFH